MPIRHTITPRANWQDLVKEHGFDWHTDENGTPYWDESAYWSFSGDEIEQLEDATERCYSMVLDAVNDVVADRAQLEAFGYDDKAIKLIRHSWDHEGANASFYTRFDFAFGAGGRPKLLEVNGDTPTSLLEGAVTQWMWMENLHPRADQFNSIHDRLVSYFGGLHEEGVSHSHVMCISPHREDEGTVSYMEEVMRLGGIDTSFVSLDGIGLRDDGYFVDANDRVIDRMFKLVPFEWMLDSLYGKALVDGIISGKITVMEPAWKMVASNKFLLETLHQKFPHDVHILKASRDPLVGGYVSKPVFGREGQNVTIRDPFGNVIENTGGEYSTDVFINQERAYLLNSHGKHAVIGSWVVANEPAGMGIRETTSLVTQNLSKFVPHIIG